MAGRRNIGTSGARWCRSDNKFLQPGRLTGHSSLASGAILVLCLALAGIQPASARTAISKCQIAANLAGSQNPAVTLRTLLSEGTI